MEWVMKGLLFHAQELKYCFEDSGKQDSDMNNCVVERKLGMVWNRLSRLGIGGNKTQ